MSRLHVALRRLNRLTKKRSLILRPGFFDLLEVVAMSFLLDCCVRGSSFQSKCKMIMDATTLSQILQGTRVRPATRFSIGAHDFEVGVKNSGVQTTFFSSFLRLFFLSAARHPADFDGRPTAGAQVLAMVSSIPWHPYHFGPALHCRVPSRSESCYFSKSDRLFFFLKLSNATLVTCFLWGDLLFFWGKSDVLTEERGGETARSGPFNSSVCSAVHGCDAHEVIYVQDLLVRSETWTTKKSRQLQRGSQATVTYHQARGKGGLPPPKHVPIMPVSLVWAGEKKQQGKVEVERLRHQAPAQH